MADITELIKNFNPENYEERQDFDNSPLPENDYFVEIKQVEFKQTANQKGWGINITFDVLGDVHEQKHKNRILFTWITLKHNESESAEEIGQRDFHSLRIAVGDPTITETNQLLKKRLIVHVGFDKKDNTRNEIKRYMTTEGYIKPTNPPKATPVATQPAPAAAPIKQKQPWE